jgi:carboxylesterase 2
MIEYAKYLGAEITASSTEEVDKQVADFYKKADAMKLGLGIHPDPEFKFYPNNTIPLGPCYDGEFFPKSLEDLRKEAPKKRTIAGVTEYEGLLFCEFCKVYTNTIYSVKF